MTQTADVAARESIFNIQCEAARLVVQRETLRSKAALQNEAIGGSLIPCLKIKEPYRRGMPRMPASPCAPGTPEPAIRSPIPPTNISTVSALSSRVRVTRGKGCTVLYGFSRLPAGD